jgi:hypothetical protein
MLFLFRSFVVAGALVASVPAIAIDHAPPGVPSRSVTVSGVVERTLTLRADELRQYPPQQIVELKLAGSGGAEASKPSVVRGVRLRDILDQAKIVKRDHNTIKKLAIIAGATDGYKAVFSWNEIFNSDAGDSVLVLFDRDGKPLAAEEGTIALISGKDTKTGPRHVKWLQSIEVRQVVE